MYIEGFVPDHVQQITIVGMHWDVVKCGVNVYFYQGATTSKFKDVPDNVVYLNV